MTYTVIKNAIPPTFEQLGMRELGCCQYCLDRDRPTTNLLPGNPKPPRGMEQIAELGIGDAIECSFQNRQKMGHYARAYDLLNGTKHELYMMTPETARCWRYK